MDPGEGVAAGPRARMDLGEGVAVGAQARPDPGGAVLRLPGPAYIRQSWIPKPAWTREEGLLPARRPASIR
ncbi:hypothetical protein TURU_000765 [Turdus rufiventris]|nr:hypothetical protein TURU_000765 [Turdus rufiventris]